MAKLKSYQARFTAGIFGRRLRAAEDLERFATGAADIVNGLCQPQGGVLKRSGTADWGAAGSDSIDTILFPFVAGNLTPYMLEFGDGTIRVLGEEGVVLHTITAAMFPASVLPELTFHSARDVIWITSRDNYAFFELRHLGPTSWTGPSVTSFKDGPWMAEDPASLVTLTPSAVTGGAITITASAAVFTSSDVGRLVRLRHSSGAMPGEQWEAEFDYSAGEQVRNAQKMYANATGGTTESGHGAPNHEDGTHSDGAIDWAYLHDGAGIAVISAYSSATLVTAAVRTRLPEAAATKYWSLGAWSSQSGFPGCGTIFEERRWLGGTALEPDRVDGSAFGDPYSHRPCAGLGQVVATDAIAARPSGGKVQPILWLAPMQRLLAGTRFGVSALQGTTETEALAPGAARLHLVSRWGCAAVPPEPVGQSLFYVQAGTMILREIGVSEEGGSYAVRNASLIADDLMSPGLAQLAWLDGGGRDGVLFARRSDGQLLGLTLEREEKVTGWHRHTLGGAYGDGPPEVQQMAVLPRASDDRPMLWLIVRRTIAGVTRRRIEILQPAFYGEEARADRAWMVDAGLRYDGWNDDDSDTMTVSGASYAADDEVTVESNFDIFGGGGGQIAVGRRLAFGRGSRPERDDDVWPPRQMEITAIAGLREATASLLHDLPERYQDEASAEWAVSATTISGLAHLEGAEVAVNVDGGDAGPLTVASGAITLPYPGFTVTVGHPFDFAVETLNLSPAPGALRGAKNRVIEIAVTVLDSLGGRAKAAGFDPTDFPARLAADPYGWPPPLRSETIAPMQANGDTQEDCAVAIEQVSPTPFCVLAVKATVQSDA